MLMLIRLLSALAQTRVWVGRLHILVRVPCGVNMFALLQNTVICIDAFYLSYYFLRFSLLFLWNDYAYL